MLANEKLGPSVVSESACVLQVPCWSREELQDVLSDALSLPWTAEQEAVLGNELGMETVVDAVGRINGFVKVTKTVPASAALTTSAEQELEFWICQILQIFAQDALPLQLQ